MKPEVELKITAYFRRLPQRVFRHGDLSTILMLERERWKAGSLGVERLKDFLLDQSILSEAEFVSSKYPPIVRYVRGDPSTHELATSLRPNSYLSHRTALELHGLEKPASTIYTNQEQAPKKSAGEITQASVNRAFQSKQRRSRYIFKYGGNEFILISGKNTNRAGVVRMKLANGSVVDCASLERTLIDIVVRPAYAGGLERVAAVYKAAASRVRIDEMIRTLSRLNYLYPYQQSIGFLLERAGRPQNDLAKLKSFVSGLDFFLDYGLSNPAYDQRWRIFYPPNCF